MNCRDCGHPADAHVYVEPLVYYDEHDYFHYQRCDTWTHCMDPDNHPRFPHGEECRRCGCIGYRSPGRVLKLLKRRLK